MPLGRLVAVAVALGLAAAIAAAPADASFHELRINEVMLSTGGNPGAQFVELLDPIDEAFPNEVAPYKLVVYDGAGQRVGAHTLSTSDLQHSDMSQPYLVSTAAADEALGTSGDDTLDVALPRPGQLCYAVQGEAPVDCVAWGCVSKLASSGTARIPAPPDGKSDQRQSLSGSTFQIAAPTPDAANTSGTSATACNKPTAGDDTLTGTPGPDTICGKRGDDTIRGLGAADTLFGDACGQKVGEQGDGGDTLNGGDGGDTLYGAGGADLLIGGPGPDKLFGGKGPDTLRGGTGVNVYHAGLGNDTLEARNGKAETVDCGVGGKDVATVDTADTVERCETVHRP